MGLKQEVQDFYTSKIIVYDQPMKKHTSLGVGGNAKYFAKADSLYTLNSLITTAKKYKLPFKVIGAGSNILVSDKGFDGLIISTVNLTDVFFKRDYVKAMAGATLNKLFKFSLEHNLTGMEALSGIPATVGGAVVMNAGAFGHSISDNLVEVETIKDGKICKYLKEECKFSYRTSRFIKSRETVVSATFCFSECERELIKAGHKSFSEIRAEIQPKGKTCGSVFKNPKPFIAGMLIEKAGLKGYTIGGATISEKHANFILNTANAKAQDVYNLILHIKQKVKEVFGVDLTEEVVYLGEF